MCSGECVCVCVICVMCSGECVCVCVILCVMCSGKCVCVCVILCVMCTGECVFLSLWILRLSWGLWFGVVMLPYSAFCFPFCVVSVTSIKV
jgi:hypothetical protein